MKKYSFFSFSGRLGLLLRALIGSRKSAELLIPIAVLVLLSLVVNRFDLDRRIAAQFFASGPGWLYQHEIWVQLLYRFGTWPILITGITALVVLTLSPFYPSLRRRSRLALFLLLLLALGPGLIVNGLFKQHFGRPRPRHVVEFGGTEQFKPVLVPNFNGKGNSFPSGHAAMGFYWIGLFVYWQRSRRWRALICLAAGLAYGGVMGTARMLQGGHWFSDVLWAAGFVYLTAWLLCQLHWFRVRT